MKRNVTSRDVAKAAGVSQSLVSLILNCVPDKKIKPETRELVLETAKKLNYQVNVNARNMKSRKAGAIGLLSSWDTHSFVFPPVIKGVQAVCSEKDLGVVICTGRKNMHGNSDYIEYFMQNRIDGLVYVSYVGVSSTGVIEELTKHGVPFVCIIGARDLPGVSCVDVSFVQSGYLAVRHLVEQGYKNIAYLTDNRPENFVYAEKERVEGCLRAGGEFGAAVTLSNAFVRTAGEKGLQAAVEKLLEAREFDSVVAISHICHTVLINATQGGIQVPKALGVISLDNELYAPYLYPPLTTVDEPLEDIAKRAMHILDDKMNGSTVCEKVELAPLLSCRKSTRA